MPEKKIVSAKDAKKGDYSKAVSKDTSNLRQENRKKNAMKFRIPAIILWVLALGCEALAVHLFNILPSDNMVWLFVVLGADALFVIVGSLLWKKANHISPCTSDSKIVCFLQNQLGVIMALIAFIPIGILVLKGNKNLNAKTKKILVSVIAILLVGSVGASIDYSPATPESVEAAELAASASGEFTGTVYWTVFGKSYHLDPECQALSRSTVIIEGTLQEALDANKTDPCDFCAAGDKAKEQAAYQTEAESETVEKAEEASEDTSETTEDSGTN
jgi:hypothetical protein